MVRRVVAELCRIQTPDGCLLDGVLQMPSASVKGAFLLLHGTGSNFYAPGVLETFAGRAVDAGFAALRVNTRGHDGMTSIPGTDKSVRGGATYEVVSDCVLDIAAWIEFLAQLGIEAIVLVGHSMGGVKALYAQAHQPSETVAGIVCISPPRFAFEHWNGHPQANAFRDHYQRAVELVQRGEGTAFIECRQPTPFLATASGFLEKYGPGDRYDLIQLIPRIHQPVLVIIGSQTLNSSPAFDSLPSELGRLASSGYCLQLEVVHQANMNYTSCPERPFELAASWLQATGILGRR